MTPVPHRVGGQWGYWEGVLMSDRFANWKVGGAVVCIVFLATAASVVRAGDTDHLHQDEHGHWTELDDPILPADTRDACADFVSVDGVKLDASDLAEHELPDAVPSTLAAELGMVANVVCYSSGLTGEVVLVLHPMNGSTVLLLANSEAFVANLGRESLLPAEAIVVTRSEATGDLTSVASLVSVAGEGV